LTHNYTLQVQDPDAHTQYAWYKDLAALGSSGTQYQLINLQVSNNGVYFAEATDGNGCHGQSNSIMINPETLSLFIPDVFTPNGDEVNDYFQILGLHLFAENELTIVNKRGKLVYSVKNYNNNWDGENQPDDIYYYLLKVVTSDGVATTYKGHVYIKR